MASPKLQARITDESRSALRRYQDVVIGSAGLAFTIKFELATGIFGNAPGAAGLWLRQRFYRSLFRRVGRGLVIGRYASLRHTRRISLGSGVVIADGCVLDARCDAEEAITIGNDVILGQLAMLRCKEGTIRIGNNVGIGSGTALYSVAGNTIEIGDYAMIASQVYIGGGRYHFDRTDVPIALQGLDSQGGNRIGPGAWLGAGAILVDGVDVGRDAIVAAGAVVTHDVPPLAIVAGVPAKVLRYRGGPADREATC